MFIFLIFIKYIFLYYRLFIFLCYRMHYFRKKLFMEKQELYHIHKLGNHDKIWKENNEILVTGNQSTLYISFPIKFWNFVRHYTNPPSFKKSSIFYLKKKKYHPVADIDQIAFNVYNIIITTFYFLQYEILFNIIIILFILYIITNNFNYIFISYSSIYT